MSIEPELPPVHLTPSSKSDHLIVDLSVVVSATQSLPNAASASFPLGAVPVYPGCAVITEIGVVAVEYTNGTYPLWKK